MRTALALLFSLVLVGCAHVGKVPSSIPAVGSSIDKAAIHVQSAENDVQHARPHADATGKEILDLASDEHGRAGKELQAAKGQLVSVQKERDTLAKQVATVSAELSKVEHGWGYRTQVFVTRVFVILAILVGLHFVLGAASFLLPLVFPAAAVAAPVLKLIGGIVNPIAWWQLLVDHIHIRTCQNNSQPLNTLAGIGQIPKLA